MKNSSRNSTSSNRRPPILYPSPGKLRGSRKRRAYSSHGPISSNDDYMAVGRERSLSISSLNSKNDDSSSKLSPTLLFVDKSDVCNNNSPLQLTPKPQHACANNSMASTLTSTSTESAFKTPGDGSRSSQSNSCYNLSPTTGHIFQHMSLRSPRLSKSPGSSFSQYTKSVISASCVTATTPGSFESSDPPSTPYGSRPRMIPLTVLSDSDMSNNNHMQSPLSGRTRSRTTLISPRPRKPSRYLISPKTKYSPSPKQDRTFMGGDERRTSPKKAAVVTVEKSSWLNNRSPFKATSISPMISLSPMEASIRPQNNDAEMSSDLLHPPPPITLLTLDGRKDKKNNWDTTKIKSTMYTSRSLFKPAPTLSNAALNEMLYPDDGDTDGSLSDSDDEGNAFFLRDPNNLSLPQKLEPPSHKMNDEEDGFGLSLSAAYSFQSKKKRMSFTPKRNLPNNNQNQRSVSRESYNSTFPDLASNEEKSQTNQEHMFPADREKESSTSTTSLFGMNIIHEHSISHASLADMGPRKTSSRNIEDLSSAGPSSFLNRSKSDQSINSLGLCLENYTPSEHSNRDMITPPVNCRAMSSPPPLKQTRSRAHKF